MAFPGVSDGSWCLYKLSQNLTVCFPADPRNRNINMDPRFAFCRQHSPQTLIIVGSLVERICLPDTAISKSHSAVDASILQSPCDYELISKDAEGET